MTNATASNILSNAITTGALNVTGSSVLTNVSLTNATTSNILSNSITTGGISVTGSSVLNSVTASNILSNAITTGGLNVTGSSVLANVTATNILSNVVTAGGLNVTGSSVLNNVSLTNATASNILSNAITSSSLNVTTNATINNLTVTNALLTNGTITNATISNTVFNSITTSNLVVTNLLNANGVSHTIGSIFITNGNIGINNTSPNAQLDTRLNTNEIGHIIRGTAGQTADLNQWQNNAGAVLSRIDSDGNFFNNTFLLWGRDSFYFESLGATSTTSTTFQNKISVSTPALTAGDYYIEFSSLIYSGTTTVAIPTQVLYNGTVILAQTSSNNLGTATPIYNGFARITLPAGITTLAFQFRTATAGITVTVNNARLRLFRIA